MAVYDDILEYIDGLSIIDTHEHLPARESARPAGNDVLCEWLSHYFSCDLVSAGLSDRDLARVRDPQGNLAERWRLAEPYWHAARTTGYGRSLDIAARDLYDLPRVDGETIGELDRRFRAAREAGGHYRRVLKEKSRILTSVLDSNPEADREFFVSVFRFDDYICPTHRNQFASRGAELGMGIHTLGDWKRAMEADLERRLGQGIAAVKCGLAYQRSLRFDKVGEREAEDAFTRFFADEHAPAWRPGTQAGKAFQDHMMHHLLSLLDARGLTLQIHTGLQEGNGNVIYHSNPVLLTNLFLEYGNVKFDIFHMGYPYMAELSNLAKNFRNVFIDMCWGHIISPEASRRALVEWLDAVPANKISAFGGDYCFVDGVYGHQFLARRNVAAALAEKVRTDTMDVGRAKEIAGWLFRDNPARLFGVSLTA